MAGKPTSLIGITPISHDRTKVYFAQASHERDLPHNSFDPWTGGFYLDVPLLAIMGDRNEADMNLFRFEPVSGQVFEVTRPKIGASVPQPLKFSFSDRQRREFYNS